MQADTTKSIWIAVTSVQATNEVFRILRSPTAMDVF